MRVAFVVPRPRRHGEMDNQAIRERLHERAPAFVFGSINEKIYLSEAGARFRQLYPGGVPRPGRAPHGSATAVCVAIAAQSTWCR